MFGYIVQRILAAVPVMGFVALFVFLMLRLTPGDPAAIIAGDTATPEQLQRIREALGLNDPLHIQFITWIGNLFQGDFGTSVISGKPVIELIAARMEPTISLALTTIILSVLIAVPLGVIAAWKHGTLIDRFVMLISVLGFSVPVFVIGYLMISLFSMQLNWFPVQGFRPIATGWASSCIALRCRPSRSRSCISRSLHGSRGPRCLKFWATITSAPPAPRACPSALCSCAMRCATVRCRSSP